MNTSELRVIHDGSGSEAVRRAGRGLLWSKRALAVLAVAAWHGVAPAATWETTQGGRIDGDLAGVYGPLVLIVSKQSSAVVPLVSLKEPELGRVADFLAAKPTAAPAWATSNSKVAKAVKGRLQVLRDNKLVTFQPEGRAEPEFYLVYFGAEWCPPCRTFSPRFVKEYARLKQLSPESFEAVFVSRDRDWDEQLKYVQHVGMPWPVLKFSQRGNVPAIERWAGRGIPCLVVLNREGDLLFDSYQGEKYLGPDNVLQRFERLLRVMGGEQGERRPEMHRFAVLQHVRAAGGGARPRSRT